LHTEQIQDANHVLQEKIISEEKKTTYQGHALVRFETPLRNHGQLLRKLLDENSSLDVWQEVVESHAIVRVPPELMRTISTWSPSPLGLHRVLHSNVQQLIEAEAIPSGTGFYQKYHSFDNLEKHWQKLAKMYPKFVQLETIGTTHEKRKITAISPVPKRQKMHPRFSCKEGNMPENGLPQPRQPTWQKRWQMAKRVVTRP